MSLRKTARQLSPYVVKRPEPAPPRSPTPTTEPLSIVLTPTSCPSIVDAAGDVWTLTATGDVDKNGASVPGGGALLRRPYFNNTIWGQGRYHSGLGTPW